jgi:hypothetical protein
VWEECVRELTLPGIIVVIVMALGLAVATAAIITVVIPIVVSIIIPIIVSIVIPIIVVVIVIMIMVTVLADAVPAKGCYRTHIEAVIGAEALRLKEIFLTVFIIDIVVEVDLAPVGQVVDGSAGGAADGRGVVQVEIDTGTRRRDEGGDCEKSVLVTHRGLSFVQIGTAQDNSSVFCTVIDDV